VTDTSDHFLKVRNIKMHTGTASGLNKMTGCDPACLVGKGDWQRVWESSEEKDSRPHMKARKIKTECLHDEDRCLAGMTLEFGFGKEIDEVLMTWTDE
jgi:hypothetical protein